MRELDWVQHRRRRRTPSWLLKAVVPALIVAVAGGALKEWADARARDAALQTQIDGLTRWMKSLSERVH